jgi:hypothetical protein
VLVHRVFLSSLEKLSTLSGQVHSASARYPQFPPAGRPRSACCPAYNGPGGGGRDAVVIRRNGLAGQQQIVGRPRTAIGHARLGLVRRPRAAGERLALRRPRQQPHRRRRLNQHPRRVLDPRVKLGVSITLLWTHTPHNSGRTRLGQYATVGGVVGVVSKLPIGSFVEVGLAQFARLLGDEQVNG